ncbi:MAG: hypothetical protein U0800_22665 [Isosphaeraceae bacterium]
MATDLLQLVGDVARPHRADRHPRGGGGIHHRPLLLPKHARGIDILADLREILPGHGRRQNLHLGNVAYHVGRP